MPVSSCSPLLSTSMVLMQNANHADDSKLSEHRKHLQSRINEEIGKMRQRKGNFKLAQEVVQHVITKAKAEKDLNEKDGEIKKLEADLAAKNKKSGCLVM